MIANIIDRRNREYRWKSVQAIVEATQHDNSCDDADQAPPGDVVFEQRDSVSIADAVGWANSFDCAVTLYLYDEGTN